MNNLLLDGNSLTIEDVYRCSMAPSTIRFTPLAKRRINASRRVVEEWVERGETIYGVTTGFGEFSNIRISAQHIEELQENLIVSHSAGAGEPLPFEIVRAMGILRLNALAKGYSGIRLETMEFFRKVFNAGITPIIPSKGSVGSSGDLAPLAHLVLALIGKGKVRYRGKVMDAKAALKTIGLKPWKLSAKEGLALVNGTQMMTAYGCLVVHEAMHLCKLADIAASMSVEALKGSDTAFDPRIHAVRPHDGQRICAANLRKLMTRSEIRESHRYDDPRIQDAYSIRCIPQVHGASRDAVRYACNVIATEVNSATDNPLIFPGDGEEGELRAVSGGNFHGQGPAMWLDFLGIAIAEVAGIAERRIFRMLTPELSHGLPAMLVPTSGLDSGLMMVQYTAAALVSDNKTLAHPDSVDSIPSCANQEDHVSMGANAARHTLEILENVRSVLAIELLTAAQAIDLRPHGIDRLGLGTTRAYGTLRQHVAFLEHDRETASDIQTLSRLIHRGELVDAVSQVVALA